MHVTITTVTTPPEKRTRQAGRWCTEPVQRHTQPVHVGGKVWGKDDGGQSQEASEMWKDNTAWQNKIIKSSIYTVINAETNISISSTLLFLVKTMSALDVCAPGSWHTLVIVVEQVCLQWQKPNPCSLYPLVHCCSTHDQHQESPNNTITQREKRRGHWKSNSITRRFLLHSEMFVQRQKQIIKLDIKNYQKRIKALGMSRGFQVKNRTAGKQILRILSPGSECRIGKRW